MSAPAVTFASLPQDLLKSIGDWIDETSDLRRMSVVSKTLYFALSDEVGRRLLRKNGFMLPPKGSLMGAFQSAKLVLGRTCEYFSKRGLKCSAVDVDWELGVRMCNRHREVELLNVYSVIESTRLHPQAVLAVLSTDEPFEFDADLPTSYQAVLSDHLEAASQELQRREGGSTNESSPSEFMTERLNDLEITRNHLKSLEGQHRIRERKERMAKKTVRKTGRFNTRGL